MRTIKFSFFTFLCFIFSVGCKNEKPQPQEKSTAEKSKVAIDSKKFAEGKELFWQNCGQCHAIAEPATGPALGGVTKRRNKKWLHDFTRNNSAMIASGDTAAINIYEEWDNVAMTEFPNLDSLDIENIYLYIEEEYANRK